MFWNFIFLVAFLVYIAIVVLGVHVFKHNPQKRSHQFFLLFSVFLSLWLATNFLSVWIPDASIARFMLYADFVLAPFFLLYLLLFLVVFPKERIVFGWKSLAVVHVVPVALALTVLIGAVIQDVTKTGFKITFVEGVLHPLYGIAIACMLLVGLGYAVFNKFSLRGLERRQVDIILAGFGVTFAILFVTNIFFHNVVAPEIFTLINLTSIILPISTSLAIMKHRFMGIKTVYKSFLQFLVLFIFTLVYTQTAAFTRDLLTDYGVPQIGTSTFFVAFFIPLFIALYNYLSQAIPKLFSNKESLKLGFAKLQEEMNALSGYDEKLNLVIDRVELLTGSRPSIITSHADDEYILYGAEIEGLKEDNMPDFFEEVTGSSKPIIASHTRFSAIVPGGMKERLMKTLDTYRVHMAFPVNDKEDHAEALILMPEKAYGYSYDEIEFLRLVPNLFEDIL